MVKFFYKKFRTFSYTNNEYVLFIGLYYFFILIQKKNKHGKERVYNKRLGR